MLTGILPFSQSTEILKGRVKLLLDSQFVTSVLPKPSPDFQFLDLLVAASCVAFLSMS